MEVRKINKIFVLSFFILLVTSCSNDDNGNDCITSGGDLDLQESECLAETLTNFCNAWDCRTDPTSETFVFSFNDCTVLDCITLQCDQETFTNLQAISMTEFTTILQNDLQGEFNCIIIVP